MKKTSALLLVTLLTLSFPGPGYSAAPPELINYQGVLRDAAGAPLNGAFPMAFRFFDSAAGANEILVDTHASVVVTDGLFNVSLGAGTVTDGSGAGTYLTLGEVFRDYQLAYLEIVVGSEKLAPRIQIVSAAYSLNAANLEGKSASEFLDTSATDQTKAGKLFVGGLSVTGDVSITTGTPGTGKVLTSDAAGQATWETPAVSVGQGQLRELGDRLKTMDPGELPFAELETFDCSGSTATMSLTIGGLVAGDVTGFVGHEEISAPFEFLVAFETTSTLTPTSEIGKIGRLSVLRNGLLTNFTGRVTELGLAGKLGAVRTYVARLEPRASDLRRNADYGIFQAFAIPDIISATLSNAGIANFQVSFSGSYGPLDMSIQYGESDFDFISRLMEQEGIHYHFREDAAEERMIFADSNGDFTAIGGSFDYLGDMQTPPGGAEHITTFHSRERQFTTTGTVGGYDFTNPFLLVRQSQTITGGIREQYVFETTVDDNAIASNRAQVLVERDQVRRLEHSGTGSAASFRAGHTFTLNDLSSAGFGGNYLLTAVNHFAVGNDPACIEYGNTFTAIPSSTPYRPERLTPRPVVKGPVTAVVTGPGGGPDPYTDSYGRVKVQFHWDRVGAFDENSSGWVRVVTPVSHKDDRLWIPRIDEEVIVDFLQGDPDRPIVVGKVYNADNLPPAEDDARIGGNEFRFNADGPDRDQFLYFYEGGSSISEALFWDDSLHRFDLTDDLEVSGDLTVTGNDILFGAGSSASSNTAAFNLTAGNANTDDIRLIAGNSIDDGALSIFGDSTFEMRSGSGLFSFINGATAIQTASLSSAGTMQMDGDLTVSGGDIALGSGPLIQGNASALTLTAGITDTDDIFLVAGNSLDDGRISIAGNSTMELRPGNGILSIVAGDTSEAMSLSDTSDPNSTRTVWTVGGANLDFVLGDSSADDTFVAGDLTVYGVKNFAQNHPYNRNLSVVYTALEGDEAGTYTRGSARLVDGVARVSLGETFAWVTNPDIGLTAHLTPRGASADLYVESITSRQLVVRAGHATLPDASFDYIVHGLRIGHEEHSVVQKKRIESTVPSPESYDRYYKQNPDLRQYNALSRFRKMDPATPSDATSVTAANALRHAVGLHDPGFDVPETTRPQDRDIVDVAESTASPHRPIDTSSPDLVGLSPSPADDDASFSSSSGHAIPLDEEGNAYARSFRTADSELATVLRVTEGVSLGDLLVVDRNKPELMRPADSQADPAVVGIVSGQPGVLLGGAEERRPSDEALDDSLLPAQAPVVFSGIVLAKVDAGYGSIRVGDLLTSSPTAGHAMRSLEPRAGTIVGKALEPLEHGTGLIRVLVMLR